MVSMIFPYRRQHSYLVPLIALCFVGNPHITTSAFTLNVRFCKPINYLASPITKLSLAKGGIHGKKTRMIKSTTKKKNTKNPNKPGKHRKISKRNNKNADESNKANKKPPSAAPSTKPKLAILGETKKAGPPWQVMGEKDMKKNVEAEKVRRERIRVGIDPSSAGSNANTQQSQKADVSGSNTLMSITDRAMLSWKRFNPTSGPSDLSMVGAYLAKSLPPSLGVPEVAFLGRSNVGKSSLLNKLVYKAGGDTARVGKTPGATASVNLYALLGQHTRKGGEAKPILAFADLPGFGYAKLSKERKESVEEAAERYLGKRRELALGVLLVDSRRVPNADDRAVLAALFDMNVPLIVVATKSDKLKDSETELAMGAIREGLGLPDGQPLRVSAANGEGVRDLWRIILDACATRVDELRLAIEEGRDDGGVMRVTLGEDDESDDFYDDIENGEYEGEEEIYEDDEEEIYYDQGYDWVKSQDDVEKGGSGDFYDDFYGGEDFIDEDDDFEEDNWNKEQQRIEKESFKLKNLKKRVEEMERRGEI